MTVDTSVVDAQPGDFFLLCSDGLTTMVADEDILGILSAAPTLDDAARELVRAANTGGGEDNVTVVLFGVVGDETVEETLVAPVIAEGNGQGDTDELEDTLTNLQPVAASTPVAVDRLPGESSEEAARLGPAHPLGRPRARLRGAPARRRALRPLARVLRRR